MLLDSSSRLRTLHIESVIRELNGKAELNITSHTALHPLPLGDVAFLIAGNRNRKRERVGQRVPRNRSRLEWQV